MPVMRTETLVVTAAPPTPRVWQLVAAFAAVYVIWGSTYLGIRYAVTTIPPFLMAGTRFFTAGLLLYAFARLRGAALPTRTEWRDATIAGALMLMIGNGGVSWAALVISARAARLNIPVRLPQD